MAAEYLIALIQQHGVLAVMLGMVLEEIIVPIPSPIVPTAAGALLINATDPFMAFIQILFIIALPASVASVISSYFVYSIAYFGGKPAVERFGRYLDISWEEIQRFEKHFDSGKEGYYVALFRAIPIVPLSLVSGGAGIFRMDWKRYGIWSFIGMMPRNIILAYIGWTAKGSFEVVASKIDKASTAVALVIFSAILGVIAYRKFKDAYKLILDHV